MQTLLDRDSDTSVELARAFVEHGDSNAASRLYHRHRDSTLRFANKGLSSRLRQRVDPEDLYQSVSVILFTGLRDGRFRLKRAGDLRALLAQLTRQRILKKAEQHNAAKRAISQESELDGHARLACDGIGPSEMAQRRDMIAVLLRQTASPRHRLVIRLAIEGSEIPEIAEVCGYSQARVRQILSETSMRAARQVAT